MTENSCHVRQTASEREPASRCGRRAVRAALFSPRALRCFVKGKRRDSYQSRFTRVDGISS